MNYATNTVHPVVIVIRVMFQPQRVIIVWCHKVMNVKGQGIVLQVVRIDLAADRMSQGEENVKINEPNIRIEDKVAIVQEKVAIVQGIDEAVNVAKDVQHQEIIDAEANQWNVDATMIAQGS